MFALGLLKIKPWEFERYTLHDFLCAWAGHQQQMQIERLSTYLIMRSSGLSDPGNLEPRDLWWLHGDKEKIDLKKLARLKKQAEQNWK